VLAGSLSPGAERGGAGGREGGATAVDGGDAVH
jgi:hypothetical protein